jgi:hypothetical protein
MPLRLDRSSRTERELPAKIDNLSRSVLVEGSGFFAEQDRCNDLAAPQELRRTRALCVPYGMVEGFYFWGFFWGWEKC